MQLTLSGFPTPSITGREEVLCVRFQGDLRWEDAPCNQPQNWKCCDYICSEPPQDLVAVGKWWVGSWRQTRQLLISLPFQYCSVPFEVFVHSRCMKDYTIRIVLMGTLEGCETRSYYRELSLISVSVSSPIIRPMEGLITSKQLCNYWPVKVMTIFKVWNDNFFPLGKSFLPADAVERTFHPKCLDWFGTAWGKFS